MCSHCVEVTMCKATKVCRYAVTFVNFEILRNSKSKRELERKRPNAQYITHMQTYNLFKTGLARHGGQAHTRSLLPSAAALGSRSPQRVFNAITSPLNNSTLIRVHLFTLFCKLISLSRTSPHDPFTCSPIGPFTASPHSPFYHPVH